MSRWNLLFSREPDKSRLGAIFANDMQYVQALGATGAIPRDKTRTSGELTGLLEYLTNSARFVKHLTFAQKLAPGVFGHPHSISSMCYGILFDERAPPSAIVYAIPTLDTLGLNQFAPWYIEHLQSIHAGKVTRPL